MSAPATVDREAWLSRALALAEVSTVYPATGAGLPRVRVSCGWPRASRGKRLAYAYPAAVSGDGTVECFVAPTIGTADAALAAVLALLPAITSGSIAEDNAVATALRDVGDPATLVAAVRAAVGEAAFTEALGILGEYPHAAVTLATAPGATRLRKLACASCRWSCRIARAQAARIQRDAACPACSHVATFTLDGAPLGA